MSPFHLEKYDYSKLTVFGFKDRGIIVCPIHGEFTQNLKNHIASKGCPKCGRKATIEKVSMTKQQLVDRLTKANLPKNISGTLKDNLYTYKSVIPCTCKIHGTFGKKVYDLLRGISCVKCRFKGYSRTEFINFCKRRDKDKAHFYLIRIYNQQESFYKIGITSTSIENRFRKLLTFTGYTYEIIKVITSTPRNIWDMENKYKKLFSYYSYTPLIYFTGYTECFNEKILEYDI